LELHISPQLSELLAQVAILAHHLDVVLLLHFQIAPHVLDLAVPVVEIIPQHRVLLLLVGQRLMQLTELGLVLLQMLLQVFNPIAKRPLISIECGLEISELLLLVFCFIVGLLDLRVQS